MFHLPIRCDYHQKHHLISSIKPAYILLIQQKLYHYQRLSMNLSSDITKFLVQKASKEESV
ncbi:hypothetical protein C5167_043600 [Papaver somniferum]|uniref:Uncharacterized protein n=1 Tax=Papaver somniferum TaxID=3469 RepID=A0A4Y7L8S9_PAPSO|nr:hypothetical protein C5167_043600 [Papaver somniferum]